jgi:hypothetical protein
MSSDLYALVICNFKNGKPPSTIEIGESEARRLGILPRRIPKNQLGDTVPIPFVFGLFVYKIDIICIRDEYL